MWSSRVVSLPHLPIPAGGGPKSLSTESPQDAATLLVTNLPAVAQLDGFSWPQGGMVSGFFSPQGGLDGHIWTPWFFDFLFHLNLGSGNHCDIDSLHRLSDFLKAWKNGNNLKWVCLKMGYHPLLFVWEGKWMTTIVMILGLFKMDDHNVIPSTSLFHHWSIIIIF